MQEENENLQEELEEELKRKDENFLCFNKKQIEDYKTTILNKTLKDSSFHKDIKDPEYMIGDWVYGLYTDFIKEYSDFYGKLKEHREKWSK